jgi:hypothetical protein
MTSSYPRETLLRRSQEAVMRRPFRLLLTGSRAWDDDAVIGNALAAIRYCYPKGVLLAHGAYPLRLRRDDRVAGRYKAGREHRYTEIRGDYLDERIWT